MWKPEIKPTANRRESRKPLACFQNRICLSSLSQVSRKAKPCSAEAAPTGQPVLDLLVPSSGAFGQILSPPQRLPLLILRSYVVIFSNMDIIQIKDSSMNLSLTGAAGAATGFARTLPMKGRARQRSWIAKVRISKSDSPRPKGGFKRGSKTRSGEQSEALRFAPIRGWFFSCVTTNTIHEIEVHLIRTSVFSFEITPHKSSFNSHRCLKDTQDFVERESCESKIRKTKLILQTREKE